MAMDQNNLWTGFQMPRRLAADSETLTERYGRFSAQPFERGFGTTIGNSLRRALLSIEGAAVTAIKIEGVEHEFSSIKGVVEDATDVILNLKQVPLSCMAARRRPSEFPRKQPAKLPRLTSRLMRMSRYSTERTHCHSQRWRLAQCRDETKARAWLCLG